jgi:hypothetical protein
MLILWVVLAVLFVPILGWRAYVIGRSPWGWGLSGGALLGLPILLLIALPLPAWQPRATEQMRSAWPRLGLVALLFLGAFLSLLAAFSALLWASGAPTADVMRQLSFG